MYCSYYYYEMMFLMLYVFSENYVLLFSYDEVVYGKGMLWGWMLGNNYVKVVGLCSLFVY